MPRVSPPKRLHLSPARKCDVCTVPGGLYLRLSCLLPASVVLFLHVGGRVERIVAGEVFCVRLVHVGGRGGEKCEEGKKIGVAFFHGK